MVERVRQYVTVDYNFDMIGRVMPTAICWTDGTKFPIDMVRDIKQIADLSNGRAGLRYTCDIRGQQRYLFLEDIGKWFLERPAATQKTKAVAEPQGKIINLEAQRCKGIGNTMYGSTKTSMSTDKLSQRPSIGTTAESSPSTLPRISP